MPKYLCQRCLASAVVEGPVVMVVCDNCGTEMIHERVNRFVEMRTLSRCAKCSNNKFPSCCADCIWQDNI